MNCSTSGRAHPEKGSRQQVWLAPSRRKLSWGTVRNNLWTGRKLSGVDLGLHGISIPCLIYLGRHLKPQAFPQQRIQNLVRPQLSWSEIHDYCWLIAGCSQEGKVHHPTRSSKAHSVLRLNSGKANHCTGKKNVRTEMARGSQRSFWFPLGMGFIPVSWSCYCSQHLSL